MIRQVDELIARVQVDGFSSDFVSAQFQDEFGLLAVEADGLNVDFDGDTIAGEGHVLCDHSLDADVARIW